MADAKLNIRITAKDEAAKAFGDVNKKLDEMSKFSKIACGALAAIGTAVAAATVLSVKNFVEAGDEIQKMSYKVGFSTEALSEWKHVLDINGASLGTLQTAVRTMSSAIIDANDGLTTYQRSFEHIGLDYRELRALKPEEQFGVIAEAIAGVEDETLRMAVAQDLFGRGAMELLPTLAQGKEGIQALKQEARDLGIVFDQESADAAANLQDEMTRLKGAISGVQFTLAKELTPSLEYLIPLVTDFARAMGPIIENTLNWHAAHDKMLSQQGAWRAMQLERQRFLGGLTNQYSEMLDALEGVLRSQGRLDEQTIATIAGLREEIQSRQELTEIIVAQTDAIAVSKEIIDGAVVTTKLYTQAEVEMAEKAGLLIEKLPTVADKVKELERAMKDQEEQTRRNDEAFEDLMARIKYTGSEAEKYGVTMFDIYDAMEKLGYTTDTIRDKWRLWGDDISSIEGALKSLGLSAKDVNKVLEELNAPKQAESQADRDFDEYAVRAMSGIWSDSPEYEAMEHERATTREMWGIGNVVEYFKKWAARTGYKFAQGGTIDEPTVLFGLQTQRPYALAGESGREYVTPSGGKEIHVHVELDGRELARVVLEEAGNQLRLQGTY